jgi:hypothetical protein
VHGLITEIGAGRVSTEENQFTDGIILFGYAQDNWKTEAYKVARWVKE